jgi:hypothetical protein
MRHNPARKMLGEWFAWDALDNAIEKKWSGGYQVRMSSAVFAELLAFQKGAILGRAKADKGKSLAKLVAQEGGEDSIYDYIMESAESLLNKYGKEPDSFQDFWFKTRFPSLDFTDYETLKALDKKKVRLSEILPICQVAATQGIGFGIINPELVKVMWRNTYETEIDPTIWEDARKHGLEIPEKQSYVPLKDMEEAVLSQVYEFAKATRPELIVELGLK